MDLFGWGVITGIFVTIVATIVRNAWNERDVSLTKQLRSMDSDICKLMASRDLTKTELESSKRTIKTLEKQTLALVRCVNFQKYMEEMDRIDELERINDERDK